jgi:hypothetical protein
MVQVKALHSDACNIWRAAGTSTRFSMNTKRWLIQRSVRVKNHEEKHCANHAHRECPTEISIMFVKWILTFIILLA